MQTFFDAPLIALNTLKGTNFGTLPMRSPSPNGLVSRSVCPERWQIRNASRAVLSPPPRTVLSAVLRRYGCIGASEGALFRIVLSVYQAALTALWISFTVAGQVWMRTVARLSFGVVDRFKLHHSAASFATSEGKRSG